jgi:hypothetical protein
MQIPTYNKKDLQHAKAQHNTHPTASREARLLRSLSVGGYHSQGQPPER